MSKQARKLKVMKSLKNFPAVVHAEFLYALTRLLKHSPSRGAVWQDPMVWVAVSVMHEGVTPPAGVYAWRPDCPHNTALYHKSFPLDVTGLGGPIGQDGMPKL